MSGLLAPIGFFGTSVVPVYFSGDQITQSNYSQLIWPGALYDATSGHVFYAYEAAVPACCIKVMEIDAATGAFVRLVVVDTHTLQNDHHGSPAIELLSDGRLVCFYGAHSSDLEWSISDQSGGSPDITNWTRQTALSAANYTYPKPVNVDSGGGAGTLHLIARDSVGTDNQLLHQSASYTSGGALSFGSVKEMVTFASGSNARVYGAEFYLNGSGNIEIAATRGDLNHTERTHVYFFEIVPGTSVDNIDGTTSTAWASLPINLTLANSDYRIVDTGSGYSGGVSFAVDTNGNRHFVYGDDTTAPLDVKHKFWDGAAFSSETTIFQAKDTDPAIGVFGGGEVTPFSLVPQSGGDMQCWFISTDSPPKLKRVAWDSGTETWSNEAAMLSRVDSNPILPPMAVRYATSDIRLIAADGAGYINNDEGAEFGRRYLYGENGWISPGPTLNDPYIYQVAFLVNFNGSDTATTYSDESHWSHLHTMTFNGNAQIDTAQYKFGSSSLYLDGTADFVLVGASRSAGAIPAGYELHFNDGDTIEAWIRLEATSRNSSIMSARSASDTEKQWTFRVNSSDKLNFFAYSPGDFITVIGTTSLTTGQWYHVAVTRDGDTYEIFLDGVSEGSDTLVADLHDDVVDSVRIGRDPANTSNDFQGWIDSIRWTKRVIRDVSTVPTSAFPTD